MSLILKNRLGIEEIETLKKGHFLAEDTSSWIITHTLKSFLSNTQHKGLENRGIF